MSFYLKLFLLVFATSFYGMAHAHARGIDYIQEFNDCRRDAYNSVTAPIVIDAEQKSDNAVIDKSTCSINTFLTDKGNVDVKRHATSDEQRRILQPLMATALIYGKTETYAHHGLTENDPLFWHFEILRAVEHLSGLYALQLRDKTSDRHYSDEWDNDYKILSSRGQITGGMFHHWFADTIVQHGAGLRLHESIKLPLPQSAARYVKNNFTIIARAVAFIFENETMALSVKKRDALIEAIERFENESLDNSEPCHLFTNEGYKQYADELDQIRGHLEFLSRKVKEENGFAPKKSKATHKAKGILGAVVKAIENSQANAELSMFNDFDFAISKISSANVVEDVDAGQRDWSGGVVGKMQDVLVQYGLDLKNTADSLRAENGVSFSQVKISYTNGYDFLLSCIARIKTATKFLDSTSI